MDRARLAFIRQRREGGGRRRGAVSVRVQERGGGGGAIYRLARIFEQGTKSLSVPVGRFEDGPPQGITERFLPVGVCGHVLADGGIKLAELGSWSPPEALGSDAAISPRLSDLQLGNISTANKTVQS